MGVYLSMHVEAWDQHRFLSFSTVFETGSLTLNLEIMVSAGLAGQRAPSCTPVHLSLPSPLSWDPRSVPSCPDFTWVLGFELRSTCLFSKHFIYRTISPTHKSTIDNESSLGRGQFQNNIWEESGPLFLRPKCPSDLFWRTQKMLLALSVLERVGNISHFMYSGSPKKIFFKMRHKWQIPGIIPQCLSRVLQAFQHVYTLTLVSPPRLTWIFLF